MFDYKYDFQFWPKVNEKIGIGPKMTCIIPSDMNASFITLINPILLVEICCTLADDSNDV